MSCAVGLCKIRHLIASTCQSILSCPPLFLYSQILPDCFLASIGYSFPSIPNCIKILYLYRGKFSLISALLGWINEKTPFCFTFQAPFKKKIKIEVNLDICRQEVNLLAWNIPTKSLCLNKMFIYTKFWYIYYRFVNCNSTRMHVTDYCC